MKVKDKKKTNPMIRIAEELRKIGFHGGELNSARGKKTFGFTLLGYSPMVQVNSGGARLSTFPQVEITLNYTLKDEKVIWEYDDDKSDKYAKGSSGLHSRLVHAIGRHPGE